MVAITGKKSAFAALLKSNLLAGDDSSTYRDVAYIRSIGGPQLVLDTADITTHDSTGGWEEVIPTILRTGTIPLEIEFDPADVTIEATTGGLLYHMKNKTALTFKIYFNDNTVEGSRTIWTLPGYVTGFTPGIPHDGALTGSLTIKLSGQPTLV